MSKYKRVLLKLSGEALAGENKSGIDADILERLGKEVANIHSMGVQVAVVGGLSARMKIADKILRVVFGDVAT